MMTRPERLKLRAELLSLIADKGYTQADLARLIDVPESTIHHWRHSNRVPSEKACQKIKILLRKENYGQS